MRTRSRQLETDSSKAIVKALVTVIWSRLCSISLHAMLSSIESPICIQVSYS